MKKRFFTTSAALATLFVIFSLTAYAHGEMRVVYDLSGETPTYKVLSAEQAYYYTLTGWSDTPAEYNSDEYTLMYSDDGRVFYIPIAESEAYSTVGLYYTPRLTMYSTDGRTIIVNMDETEMYEAANWYIEPTALVYRAPGEAEYIIQSDIDVYRQNGWKVKQCSNGLDGLKDMINNYIGGSKGAWGVYVKNLKTGDYLILNDDQYHSASIIKLFVMAAVYHEIDAGNLPYDGEIFKLLKNMITVSDNYSSNLLVKRLGHGNYKRGFDIENANNFRVGCVKTQHRSLFIGYGDYVSYGTNMVSPVDCGIMLENIYNGKLVSQEYSADMLGLLKGQQRRNKIPYPLPKGTETGNKTGETKTVESDVGIVFSPACDYVICVLTNGSNNGIAGIRQISRMTYDYMQAYK